MTRHLIATALLAFASLPLCSAIAQPPAVEEDRRSKTAPRYELTDGPKGSQALTISILQADHDFFAAWFDECNVDKVASMVTDDFEMYHDKGGLQAHSRADLIKLMTELCAKEASGQNFKSRREIVPGSVEVFPINDYGAIERGTHRFYARISGKPDSLTETGDLFTLWKKVGDRWLMARAFSYSHALAQ